jgi:glycosyltransferase involved in cell wall biosynthesis
MPLISVIIPAYNAEKTIRESIDSALKQTCSDFELIVVDDGSTDATAAIVAAVDDPRIKLFSYTNAGGAVARNRGLAQATGEFVAFLDADDLWLPEKLSAQLTALKACPEAKVAYCWTDSIDESGQALRQGCHITANGNVFAKLLLVCFVVSGSNPLIYRSALLEINGFDESLTASQDYDLYLRLAARYPFVAVPAPLVLYRLSRTSMSTNLRRLEATSLQVRKQAFAKSLQPLSPVLLNHSIANFYKSALFRILNDPASRTNGWIAAQFLWRMLRHDPSLLRRRVLIKLLFKTVVIIGLPAQAQFLFSKFKELSNLNSLNGYIRLEPMQLP